MATPSSKILWSYFIVASVLVVITMGIWSIPFAAADSASNQGEQEEDLSDEQWELELKDPEENFDSLFILFDIDQLEAALKVDHNFSQEQKIAFGWKNSTEAQVLSALGQVS